MHGAAFAAAVGTLVLVAGVWLLSRALRRASANNEQLVASFAGGVSLSFVMLDLFVELFQAAGHDLHVRAGPEPEHTIALLILVGAAGALAANVYAGRRRSHAYAVAVIPFIAYGTLVGAALEEELHEGVGAFVIFALAMMLHFGVAEHGLDHAFPNEHRGVVRVVTIVAPLVGATVSALIEPSLTSAHEIIAVIAGATILSIFRDEIPSPSDAKLRAFFAGVVAFGALVYARWWF